MQGRGCAEENEVPGDGPGVIVHDYCQPRPCGLAVGVQDQDVQLRVICLPQGVWLFGAVAKDRLIVIPERRGAVVGKCHQVGIEGADDTVDGAV